MCSAVIMVFADVLFKCAFVQWYLQMCCVVNALFIVSMWKEPRCPTVEGRPGKLLDVVWWLIPIAVHTGVEDETKIKRNPCTLCHQLHCVCVPIALCVISCMQRRITAL